MKKCLKCGFESQEGNFCPKCGNGFVEVSEQPATEQTSFEQPVAEPTVDMQQMPVMPAWEPEENVTVGEWMITLLLTAIPCVNLIMLLVWAFGGGAKKSKSNWAKATLIFMLISLAISLILGIIMGLAGVSMVNQMYY